VTDALERVEVVSPYRRMTLLVQVWRGVQYHEVVRAKLLVFVGG